MINIIKHGKECNIQEYSTKCPACECVFTYTKYDVNTSGNIVCPECKTQCESAIKDTFSAKDILIEEIMSNFDFEKVQKIMISTEWTWGEKVPDLSIIKYTARRLLKEAYDKKTTIASGGFIAKYLSDDEEESLQLFFGEYVNNIFINPNTKDIKYY